MPATGTIQVREEPKSLKSAQPGSGSVHSRPGLPVEESADEKPQGNCESCPGRFPGYLWASRHCYWKHPRSMVLRVFLNLICHLSS